MLRVLGWDAWASLLRPSGDYRSLLSYRKAEQIYDLTYYFCKAYLSSRDRTVDQMVQAARSGKQNIAEGKEAGLGLHGNGNQADECSQSQSG